MTEFKAFPKIPRLNRDCVITEKLDGTNVCVVIEIVHLQDGEAIEAGAVYIGHRDEEFTPSTYYKVYAQSRNRIITPEDDNYGFAKWVYHNAENLSAALGEGYHYGEWWGQGIQRKYGLDHKRFSLFNVHRWESLPFSEYGLDNVGSVPVLYRGKFNTWDVENCINELDAFGSKAAPGFMKPEGVIIWHEAAQQLFKVTCEGDEKPKGQS